MTRNGAGLVVSWTSTAYSFVLEVVRLGLSSHAYSCMFVLGLVDLGAFLLWCCVVLGVCA